MLIQVMAPGKVKKGHLRTGCEDYLNRLKHYGRTQVVEVKEEPIGKRVVPSVVLKREGIRLLARIPIGAACVVLDERGQSMRSEALAEWLRSHRDRGIRTVVFIIGGPLGLAPEVLERAELRLSLSAMTLPHELARLVLLEQLYRAHTILNGEPYHNP